VSAFQWSLLTLTFSTLAFGQGTTGTITGRIVDPTDALIAGARIVVTSQQLGFTRTAASGESGEYTVPFLPAGEYSVRAEKQGFKARVETNIQLEIQQVRRVDLQLELGSVADAITVESTAPLLDTDSTQAGEVIRHEQVTNLPLGIRQALGLAFLAPMTVPAANDFRSTEISRGTSVPAAGGQRPEQNNYQIDGVDNREAGRNGFAISPPVDSVGEFKVQTGVAPAEFGRGGGTIINMTTRSGSNETHGTLYEFLRNDFFDARPYFSDRVSPLKRNQFGGALGGPLVRNRLFYFGNYEGLRQAAAGNPPVGLVLTPAERQGTFTTAVTDPVTKAPFPNNQIPASRISPISAKILELWPLPNNPDPLRNFVFNGRPSGLNTNDNTVVRADYNLSVNDFVYGRYLFNQEEQGTPASLPPPANSGGRILALRAQGASAHWNRVFTTNVVNNVSLGYTRYRNSLASLNSFVQDYFTSAGITNVWANTNPRFWGAPTVSIPGYLTTSEVTPNYRISNSYQLQDIVSWNRGAHTFKIGGDLRDTRTNMFYSSGNGGFTFANRYSGNNVADFLLGVPSQISKQAVSPEWNSRQWYSALFIDDTWKVSSRLTITLGLRWEVESVLKISDGCGSGFDVIKGALIVTKNCDKLDAVRNFYTNIRPEIGLVVSEYERPYDRDNNNLAPRVGLAYRIASRTVLRAGYGIFYDSPLVASLASVNSFPPLNIAGIWTGNPTIPDLGYNPEGNLPPEQTQRTAPLSYANFTYRHFPYGKINQWNFNIQHQLGNSFVIETMYQGSAATQLMIYDNWNSRPPGPGNVQQQLPFPTIARIQNWDSTGRASFHGASVKVEQRLAHGLSYLASYTFSKSIDLSSTINQGPQWTDPRDKNSAKGVSDFNVPHRFTSAFDYAFPIGAGKPFLAGLGKGASRFVSGWGVRGVVTLQSGLPQTAVMNLARTGVCAVACVARPDRIGEGNLSGDEQTIDRYYDVNAFRLLANGGVEARTGTAGRNILITPGDHNYNLQLFKNTQLFERHLLDFRWELYNAFNHTQWGAPAVNMELPATFGRITSTAAPRIMQLALKYTF
jgi:hypothetical protein